MRAVLVWLMMLGFVAQLAGRTVPALMVMEHSHAHDASHEGTLWHFAPDCQGDHRHDCSEHPSDQKGPSHGQGDDQVPCDDSHLHIAEIPTGLTHEIPSVLRIGMNESTLWAYEAFSQVAPEGPFLDQDCPPII